jgi:patatin-related protein
VALTNHGGDTDVSAWRGTAPSGVRELRLALVCYGGVSLAIYMHGVTKELQKLVAASALLDQETNPFGGRDGARDSAAAWWEFLRGLREGTIAAPSDVAGVTVQVVVDIIAGTSAGGINGICLAKALAGNHSQEGLTNLWFERGDIGQLLGGPLWLPWQMRLGVRALRMLARPVRARPPLRGDRMCEWVHGALAAMSATTAVPDLSTLAPQRLRLFVPIVDLHGYNRDIPLYDPRFVTDRTHRHVMAFSFDGNGTSHFGPEYDHALAFTARATSSIPGGFAPISFDDYAKAVRDDVDIGSLERQFFGIYEWAGHAKPRETQFIDGGVLDNFPFASAIEAIPRMPAGTEVDRRLLYVEPDPGEPGGASGGPRLALWRTVYAGLGAIPRHEPILDDMLALTRRNEHVLRIRDVIEANFDRIRHKTTDVLDEEAPVLPERPDAEMLADLWRRTEARAAEDLDVAYPTYLRLRVRTVVDAYAALVADALELPADSDQASFVTAALRQWARRGGLLAQHDPDGEVRAAQQALLAGIDLLYHERHIRFVIAALNWWYRGADDSGTVIDAPARADLDAAKRRLYDRLQDIRQIRDGLRRDDALANALARLFAPDDIAEARSTDEFAVAGFVDDRKDVFATLQDRVERAVDTLLPEALRRLHADVVDVLAGWSAAARLDLLTRYLGFPFWDILVFPLEALSGVDERDHVEVYRVSPRDVGLLAGGDEDERRTLEGERWLHFGAFFSRAGRERDYLWGRMDAVERLTKLLLDLRRAPDSIASTPATPEQVAPQVTRKLLEAVCQPIFAAVIDEERHRLRRAQDLVERLDKQVDELRPT